MSIIPDLVLGICLVLSPRHVSTAGTPIRRKDIVEEFYDAYKDVFVKNRVTFRGASYGNY